MAAAAAEEALKIDPDLADAHSSWPGWTSTTLVTTRANGSSASSRPIRRISTRGRSGRDRLRPRRQGDVRRRDGARAGHQPELRRGLWRRRRSGRAFYRFDEAVALTRRAIELSVEHRRARSGTHLMRTGDEAEARRVLDRTYKVFPTTSSPSTCSGCSTSWRSSTSSATAISCSSSIRAKTTVLASTRFRWPTKRWKKLSATYQFTPKGPILIEISRSTMTSRFATSVCLDLSARSAPASAAS